MAARFYLTKDRQLINLDRIVLIDKGKGLAGPCIYFKYGENEDFCDYFKTETDRDVEFEALLTFLIIVNRR